MDKQLAGQASVSPFMSIREGASRKVSFDIRDELGDKKDKLTVMLGRLASKDNSEAEEEDKTKVIVREIIRTG